MDDLLSVLTTHQRAIRPEAAAAWIEESRQELGPTDGSLLQLEAEVRLDLTPRWRDAFPHHLPE